MSEIKAPYSTNVGPASLEVFKGRRCALPYAHPDYLPPDPEEVAALISLAGWSQREVAMLVGVNHSAKGSTTIRKWRTKKGQEEHRAIPYSAWRLMLFATGVTSVEDDLTVIQRCPN